MKPVLIQIAPCDDENFDCFDVDGIVEEKFFYLEQLEEQEIRLILIETFKEMIETYLAKKRLRTL